MRVKRALTVRDIRNFMPHKLRFDGRWKDSIGAPELTGSWIIWGNSANGKTRFALQLAKYLSRFARVAYNSLEEGLSDSLQQAILATGMEEVQHSIVFLDKEPIKELAQRLRKRKSPDVIIIDSLQYTGMTYQEYIQFKDEFREKLFIWVSHAEGKEPKGNLGKSIRYDANVKIPVIGYKAFPQSRYGGGNEYVIWQKGAEEYW